MLKELAYGACMVKCNVCMTGFAWSALSGSIYMRSMGNEFAYIYMYMQIIYRCNGDMKGVHDWRRHLLLLRGQLRLQRRGVRVPIE
jgi:hypothetical protein